MKHTFKTLSLAAVLALTITSCKKDVKAENAQTEVSEETLSQIKAAGFYNGVVKKVEGGYSVDGDIILTEDDLRSKPTSPDMVIANEEHYLPDTLVKTSTYATIK